MTDNQKAAIVGRRWRKPCPHYYYGHCSFHRTDSIHDEFGDPEPDMKDPRNYMRALEDGDLWWERDRYGTWSIGRKSKPIVGIGGDANKTLAALYDAEHDSSSKSPEK